jgi:signal transduction histidine kinase
VSIGLEGGNLTVSVTDCGPGIDPERLPGLFGEFEQGGSVPRSGERGIGLGLAIVKRNAELLGGTVQAEANKPRGMRFSVMMPPMERRASR